MRKKIKKITDLVLVVGFLGFIFFVPMKSFTSGLSRAKKDIKQIKTENLPYNQISRKIKDLRDNLFTASYRKNDFINLNGLVARCLGMNSLNNVQILKNGYLAGFSSAANPLYLEKSAQNVSILNNFLLDRGIPFLYILVPGKNSFYEDQFRVGYGDESKQNITIMIDALNAAGVKNINMDAWFKENGWHIEDAYFKTDGHWKPEAAIAAARYTMEFLQERGVADYDEEKLRDDSYRKDVYKDWYLGALARRTGKYFGGLDDITDYRPKFKTDYLFAMLRYGGKGWMFGDSLLNLEMLEKRNFFESDLYCMYLYGPSPLQIIYNPLAKNKKRVVVTGDSFSRAWLCFLATQFQEIHLVDLRGYSNGTFAQYVIERMPDAVIMCLGTLTGKPYDFGIESYLAALEGTDTDPPIHHFKKFELLAYEKENDKHTTICKNLEPNQAYTLTVDRTALAGVEHSFVQMTLQNLSTNKAIFNRYFESNSGARQKWIFSTPEGDDAYGIFLYAGTKGHTAGIDAKVEGIALRKGIFED